MTGTHACAGSGADDSQVQGSPCTPAGMKAPYQTCLPHILIRRLVWTPLASPASRCMHSVSESARLDGGGSLLAEHSPQGGERSRGVVQSSLEGGGSQGVAGPRDMEALIQGDSSLGEVLQGMGPVRPGRALVPLGVCRLGGHTEGGGLRLDPRGMGGILAQGPLHATPELVMLQEYADEQG